MDTAPVTPTRSGWGLTLLGAGLHAVLAVALLALHLNYVPAARRTFDEYGFQPPAITTNVIGLSGWLSDWWWALVPLVALALVVDVLLIRRLAAARLWVVVTALVAAIGTTVYAVELPKAKLREGLNR